MRHVLMTCNPRLVSSRELPLVVGKQDVADAVQSQVDLQEMVRQSLLIEIRYRRLAASETNDP